MSETGDTPVPAQPMLSIWGSADGSHPPQNVHTLRALRPDVRCETLDGLGHTPELEDPAAVFDIIRRFDPH
jgi:pimeloyl-ACP methyl ester carboxylesterase